jgi:glucose/arabinose dehydrogenase
MRVPAVRRALWLASVVLAVPGMAHAQAPPDPSRFQKVLLEDTNLGEPVRIAVAPDGRVIFITRQGAVRVWSPSTGDTVLAGTVPTQTAGETGMIGLTLAPDFATTGHIYLNYAMPGFNQTASPNFRRQRTSRFTLSPANALDLTSERPIYDSINAGGGGHSGGDLEMAPDGTQHELLRLARLGAGRRAAGPGHR